MSMLDISSMTSVARLVRESCDKWLLRSKRVAVRWCVISGHEYMFLIETSWNKTRWHEEIFLIPPVAKLCGKLEYYPLSPFRTLQSIISHLKQDLYKSPTTYSTLPKQFILQKLYFYNIWELLWEVEKKDRN